MSARFFAAAVGAVLIALPLAFAQADTLTPTSCDQLFNLPQGTITTTSSAQYLNAQTCSAYQYLIARYTNPGPCSTVGFTNPQVQGITSLNTQFAQELAQMLQAANAAGFNITINSAFRTVQGEKCANPAGFEGNAAASLHTKGLAADLNFPGDSSSAKDCDSGNDSQAYLWVAANAKKYGLGLYDQLHAHVNGECNHVETATAVAGGVGPGGGSFAAAQQTLPTSVLGATRNPLLVSAMPLTTSAANPFATPPITATQPSAQASQACTPQYYCSNNTAYYESSTCSTSVFEACQYGCSGTICAPAPSQSTTNSSQPAGITPAAPLTTTSGLALNGSLSQSIQESLGQQGAPTSSPVIATIIAGTSTLPESPVGQTTLTETNAPAPTLSSPLLQLLDAMKTALQRMLSLL